MKKIVYFKLLQLVLTLVFIWQIFSMHQFCGKFVSAKTFLFDALSERQCKRFALIGNDATSGEYGALFDDQKWHHELLMMSSNSGQPNEQQKLELIDKFAQQAPTAGRHCIPISISPIMCMFGKDKTHLDNIVDMFAVQLFFAVLSLAVFCGGILAVLGSSKYNFTAFWCLFYCLFCWCSVFYYASLLLLHWTSYWFCTNFRADATDVPLIPLVLSIVLAFSFVAEIFFNDTLLHKGGSVSVKTAAHNHQQQQKKNDATTKGCCANVVVHGQCNGSAITRV